MAAAAPGPLLALLYHRVLPQVREDLNQLCVQTDHFAAQLDWLREHAVVLSPAAWLAALEDQAAAGANRAPVDADARPRVLLTFDDGYADNVHHALPILQAHGCAALLFVVSALVGSDQPYWWDALESHVRQRLRDASAAAATGDAEIADCYAAWHVRLRTLPHARRAALLERLARRARVALTADDDARPATWAELHAWLRAGGAIGGHTRTHPVLATLGDDEMHDELIGGLRDLTGALNRPITTASYPFGGRRDFDQRACELLRRAGCEAAFANFEGPVRTDGIDRFQIPRHIVRDWPVALFAEKVTGWCERMRLAPPLPPSLGTPISQAITAHAI